MAGYGLIDWKDVQHEPWLEFGFCRPPCSLSAMTRVTAEIVSTRLSNCLSCGGSFAITSARLRLQPDYVCSLRSLCTLNYLEFDGFPFVQRSESIACDCRVMNKHIWSVVTSDETVPLGVVEPLNLTSHTSSSPGIAFFGIRGDVIMPLRFPYSK